MSATATTPARGGAGKAPSSKLTTSFVNSSQKIYEITSSATFDDGHGHRASSGVACVLSFGGGESLDELSNTVENSSFVRLGAANDSTTYSMNTFEDDVDVAGSRSVLSTTPPRRTRPALSSSPSTATATAAIAPINLKPTNTGRVAVSPTRERGDSEFSKQLALVVGVGVGSPPPPSHPNVVSPAEAVVDEWKQVKTPEGKFYYYNRRTRATQWRRPESGIIIPLPEERENQTTESTTLVHKKDGPVPDLETTTADDFFEQESRQTSPTSEAREAYEWLVSRFAVDKACFDRFMLFVASERTIQDKIVDLSCSGYNATERCPDCGRAFEAGGGRLEKHLKGCRTILEKRPPTDFSRRRQAGTPMEFSSPAKPNPVVGTDHRPRSRPLLSTASLGR